MNISCNYLKQMFSKLNTDYYKINGKPTCKTLKCGFCRKLGHNITNCKDDSIIDTVMDADFEMAKISNNVEMNLYLNSKNALEINALTAYNKMKLDTKTENINKLISTYTTRNNSRRHSNTHHLYDIQNGVSNILNIFKNSDDMILQIQLLNDYTEISFARTKQTLHLFIVNLEKLYTEFGLLQQSYFILSYIMRFRAVVQETIHKLDLCIEEERISFQSRVLIMTQPNSVIWNINCVLIGTKNNVDNQTIVDNPSIVDNQTIVDTECPICYETPNINNMCKMNCTHEYCVNCMNKYLNTCKNKVNPSCGLCRTQIETISMTNPQIYTEINTIVEKFTL
jgi:hypothetical protein